MKHFALIGGCLAALGSMMGALHDWSEAMKPAFIGGAMGVIGLQITALYTQRPNEKRTHRVVPPFSER